MSVRRAILHAGMRHGYDTVLKWTPFMGYALYRHVQTLRILQFIHIHDFRCPLHELICLICLISVTS